jgi:hypothetical protein
VVSDVDVDDDDDFFVCFALTHIVTCRMTGVVLPVDAGATVAAGSELPKDASINPGTLNINPGT